MISNRCARKSLVTNCNSIISKNYSRFLVDSNVAKYKLDDDFDGKPEYDELYTELTGCIQIIIERNELPVF